MLPVACCPLRVARCVLPVACCPCGAKGAYPSIVSFKRDKRYWLKEKRFSMLLKKSLYFFNKPLSLVRILVSHYLCIPLSFLLRGIMAERKKIFYAKKAARAALSAIIPCCARDKRFAYFSRSHYFLFECVKPSCAPKRYQPYTSCLNA